MPYVQTDLRIHYRVVGDGPPLLWHTGGCGDAEMWELGGYLDRLPGLTHLLMDHRGRGRSEAPQDMAGHHMSRYVADALAVLDDADVDEAAFVGYSFGARVGFALAMSAPERLTGLVALDAFPDPEEPLDDLRAEASEVLTRGTRDVIEEFVGAEREPVPAWLVDHLCSTDPLAFAGAIEAEATAPDLWASASSLDVPVLLLLGVDGEDQRETVLGRRLVEAMPHGELVTIDAAHLAAFHRVDLTVPVIARFLSAVTSDAQPTRVEQPPDGDERTIMLGWLEFHRDALRAKCEGLTPEQLVERSADPSHLSLLGLVRHMAEMERAYGSWPLGNAREFHWVWGNYEDDAEDDIDCTPDDVEPSFAAWQEERSKTDAALVRWPDLAARSRTNDRSIRWNIAKLVGEYARHNGHADLIRERIDGQTGE